MVFNSVVQSLSDIEWLTWLIKNFKAFGYCLGKNSCLIANWLYIFTPERPSHFKFKSTGINPIVFEGCPVSLKILLLIVFTQFTTSSLILLESAVLAFLSNWNAT